MNIQLLEDLDIPQTTIPADTVVLEENKPGGTVYVLIDGEIVCRIEGHEIARFHQPGTVIGEISALLQGDCTASVVTVEASTFYRIDNLIQFFIDHPEIAVNVSQTLAARMVTMNNQFCEVREAVMALDNQLSKYIPVFKNLD